MAKTKSRNPNGRRTPVPVTAKRRPWGAIVTYGVVGVLSVGLIVAAVLVVVGTQDPEDVDVAGDVDYFAQGADWVEVRDHQAGPVDYEVQPPAGGPHNGVWQTCSGIVYTEPIPSEHAVHSLEHGAVWVTYRPDLNPAQVETLADLVDGRDYTLMSPFPDLDAPISLQAWGYQLTVDTADDERIEQFIDKYRVAASQEPGATCSGGVQATGDTPVEAPGGM